MAFLLRHAYTALVGSHPTRGPRRWSLASVVNLPNALAVCWILLLWWGERTVFRSAIDECHWNRWERWAPGATPHHLVFIADPQLVDPHTYPGRPWPLSTLTVRYTDLYLGRSYSLLQGSLTPDTTAFLGDLFDGGREWSTVTSESPEKQWKKYGEEFWLREYRRFGGIFFDNYRKGEHALGVGQRGRKILASLPGNHDLGLGVGIQLPVRDRFYTYFGEGSRVDIIGNHSLVSVDTVSLSAKGQTDPATASQSSGEKIWKPVEEFLDGVQAEKIRATGRELEHQQGTMEGLRWPHKMTELNETIPTREIYNGSAFPTILLTHVPLYRPGGTPCGPLREHWPPTAPPKGQTEPLDRDERNAISVHAGYQYQNVLTPEISAELVDKVGDVAHVFSGDDHDYCEVVHKSYTGSAQSSGGGIKEITVKSMSWAMGVRKPGFLMLSLWNPVDSTGSPLGGTRGGGHGGADGIPPGYTMESHLCLLPDQLGIFIRYGQMFGLTLVTLVISALLVSVGILPASPYAIPGPLLPVSNASDTSPPPPPYASHLSSSTLPPLREKEKEEDTYAISHSQTPSDSSTSTTSQSSSTLSGSHPPSHGSTHNQSGLAARTTSARTRSASPNSGGYGIPPSQAGERDAPVVPLIHYAGHVPPFSSPSSKLSHHHSTAFDTNKYARQPMMGLMARGGGRPGRRGRVAALTDSLARSSWMVARLVLPWYLWLLWIG